MRHLLFVDDPHPCSQAAYILLRRSLQQQELQHWLDIRKAYFSEQRQKRGDLVCSYCSKPNLVEELPINPTKRHFYVLATVDHIHPVAKGGARFDKANFAVACYPCNQQKSDKILET